jgi:hypothetical protein
MFRSALPAVALAIASLLPTVPVDQRDPTSVPVGAMASLHGHPTDRSPGAADANGQSVRQGDVWVRGATSGDLVTIRWALERFNEAGLDLPSVVIEVFEGADGCDGNQGLFVKGDGPDRIELCNTDLPIVLHELGHAWEVNRVTDGTRSRFLDELGLTSWSSPDVAWGDRGVEQAAQTIAFGLAPRPLDAHGAALHERLLAGYELLTGHRSPRVASPAGD